MGFYISLSDEGCGKDWRKGLLSVLLELLVLCSQHPLRAPLPFNISHFNTGLTTESYKGLVWKGL